MWAQLPNLCQESSIKLLCIHIPLCRVPGTNLWPPLSPHHSRGSCPLFSSVKEAGRAVTWVTLEEGLQRAPCSFLHFCPGTDGSSVTSPEQRSACKCSPVVSTAGFSLAKGQHSNAVHCWNSSDRTFFGFSQAFFQNEKKMPHRHSFKQEKNSSRQPLETKASVWGAPRRAMCFELAFKPDFSWGHGEFFCCFVLIW